MRILHVLSQFEVTGAEIYAIALMEEQQKSGHTVYVTSDTFSKPHLFNYFTCSVGNRKYLNRFHVYNTLKKFVLEKNIDVLHAHSRAASWVSHWVSIRTHVPLISTIHGLQHIHLSSKLFSIYGDQIIAICENISSQLKNKLNISAGITTIRNGLDLSLFPLSTSTEKQTTQRSINITYLGRLTGPKGEFLLWFIKNVFPKFHEKYNNSKFIIVGGKIVPQELPDTINDINNKYQKEIIEHITFQDHICPYIERSDMCIGSGRVAMEVMALNKPVIAVGESCYIGLIDKNNIERALITNFGDCSEVEKREIEPALNDLTRFAQDPDKYHEKAGWYREFIEKNYNISIVNSNIEEIYKEKISLKRISASNLNVLMYHKVVNNVSIEPRHQIYVTKDSFECQVRYLLEMGYTPITFIDLLNFYNGEFTLPEKPVIITFDDGYKNNYDIAFRIANKYGIKFVVFIIGKEAANNFWDEEDKDFSSELLNTAEILEMADYGIEFGSHTINHWNLNDLNRQEIYSELYQSKKYIENILQSPVYSVAYPYGGVDERVKICAREAGYKFGISTTTGPLNFFKDAFEIRRIPIFPNTDLIGFRKKISKYYPFYKEFKYKIRRV